MKHLNAGKSKVSEVHVDWIHLDNFLEFKYLEFVQMEQNVVGRW